MIQDYLKTSLVFYDAITKQHRHNDCCQETVNWDKLKSPTDRFLPFQIRIPTDEWFGDINSVTLYDDENNVVANLIAAYGIRPMLELVSNCSWSDTYVWVIYNGDILSAALPVGEHYIKITDDAGHAWYSELFMICDMAEQIMLSDELVIEWNNADPPNDFTILTTDGSEILRAQDAGIAGPIYSNSFLACRDRLYYNIDFVQNDAARPQLYATDADTGGVISNIVTIGLLGTGNYNGYLTLTSGGSVILNLLPDSVNCDFSGTFDIRLATATTFDGMIGLEWYNECDFDGIIYQEKDTWYTEFCAYSNRLYFERHLETPRIETNRDEEERLGVRFTKSIVQKKFYMFSILVPEFLYNVIQTLQLYANEIRSAVYIYLDNGDIGHIKELNVTEEWVDGNCYCKMTIEFREDAVVWTNCCDNYALRDESSCS